MSLEQKKQLTPEQQLNLQLTAASNRFQRSLNTFLEPYDRLREEHQQVIALFINKIEVLQRRLNECNKRIEELEKGKKGRKGETKNEVKEDLKQITKIAEEALEETKQKLEEAINE